MIGLKPIAGERVIVCLEVKDTGVGIAHENLSSIFDLFYQVDKSICRRFGGTGHGLSICKQLSEMMDVVFTDRSTSWIVSLLSGKILMDNAK
jgi:signal transduction histidine kinase